MNDDFVYYYQRELETLKKLAAEFSEDNPKIAKRLRVSPDLVEDPHVERLLEGSAFLAGRTQKRLDDEYPELTDAMLDVLFPHVLSPMPCASIVELFLPTSRREKFLLEKGTSFSTLSPEGEKYPFMSTMETEVWPIKAEKAFFEAQPFKAPKHPKIQHAKSYVRISLKLFDKQASFGEISPENLCFYLNASDGQAITLFELMTQHLIGILIADDVEDTAPVFVPPSVLEMPGFDIENFLLPDFAQSFSGFHFLYEYFGFLKKFLFIKLKGLSSYFTGVKQSEKVLYFFFNVTNKLFETLFHADILKLNCVPVINLFEGSIDPISLDLTKTSYPLIADSTKRNYLEVWRLKEVYEILENGERGYWRSLYQNLAYHETQALGRYTLGQRFSLKNSKRELFFNPIDFEMDTQKDSFPVLSMNAWLHNGNLPLAIPFGKGAPYFKNTAFKKIESLTPFSPCWQPVLHDKKAWSLISHLTLDHLCEEKGEKAAASLKKLLSLYDVCQTAESTMLIESLISVNAVFTTMRHPQKVPLAFCKGIKISLIFERKSWHRHGIYLLACILERFLALNATINTFVVTSAYLKDQQEPIAVFPPRIGLQELI
ncbi:type VI secretion system baseplate subunit TssF [Acetobacteraceae bacterium]|nr:type VI secretion system baseplate subunit TssF [Acetobacteraceae bacterium]